MKPDHAGVFAGHPSLHIFSPKGTAIPSPVQRPGTCPGRICGLKGCHILDIACRYRAPLGRMVWWTGNPARWTGLRNDVPLGLKIFKWRLLQGEELASSMSLISGVRSARIKSIGRTSPKSVFLKFGLRASRSMTCSSQCHQAEPIRSGGRS